MWDAPQHRILCLSPHAAVKIITLARTPPAASPSLRSRTQMAVMRRQDSHRLAVASSADVGAAPARVPPISPTTRASSVSQVSQHIEPANPVRPSILSSEALGLATNLISQTACFGHLTGRSPSDKLSGSALQRPMGNCTMHRFGSWPWPQHYDMSPPCHGSQGLSQEISVQFTLLPDSPAQLQTCLGACSTFPDPEPVPRRMHPQHGAGDVLRPGLDNNLRAADTHEMAGVLVRGPGICRPHCNEITGLQPFCKYHAIFCVH